MELAFGPLILLVLLAVVLAMGFKVLREYERAVIFRFGRVARGLVGGHGPGIVVIMPLVDKLLRVSLRTVAMNVPPKVVITPENQPGEVNASIYFRVGDQQRAI